MSHKRFYGNLSFDQEKFLSTANGFFIVSLILMLMLLQQRKEEVCAIHSGRDFSLYLYTSDGIICDTLRGIFNSVKCHVYKLY